MNETLEATRKKIRRYWTEDGLPDLYLGVGLVLYGALSWWAIGSPARGAVYVQSLFLPVWIGLGSLALRWLKERITYPRTGFVAYADPPHKKTARRILTGLALLTMLALILLYSTIFGQGSAGDMAFAMALPVLFALGLGAIAWHQGSVRYAVYAAVALLAGVGMAVDLGGLSADARRAVLWGVPFFLTLGTVLFAGGAWQLLRYLRHHPEAGEAV